MHRFLLSFRSGGTTLEDCFEAIKEHNIEPVLQYIAENKNNPDKINVRWKNIPFLSLVLALNIAPQDRLRLLDALLAIEGIILDIRYVNGDCLLHEITDSPHAPILPKLLAHKSISINAKGDHGQTPLIRAVAKSQVACIKMLLNHPETLVNLRDDNGNTAFTTAAPTLQLLQLLAERDDVDINARNNLGDTALIRTARNDHCPKAVRFLLELKGIDINAVNNDGDSALMCAAAAGNTDIVVLLLAAHADTTITNEKGKTAETMAEKECIRELIKNSSPANTHALFLMRRDRAAVNPDNMQAMADLAFASLNDAINFIETNLNKIDPEKINEAIFAFSTLMMAMHPHEKSDEYARTLLRVAASRGHQIAAHITQSYTKEDSKLKSIKDDKKLTPEELNRMRAARLCHFQPRANNNPDSSHDESRRLTRR